MLERPPLPVRPSPSLGRIPATALAALVLVAACVKFPISRVEGTTTTYLEEQASVQVLPPRAARAQKVVLDDPAVLAIQERDTPFRMFFSERSKDFDDVDYAKVTILSDVLHRLKNRSYVRDMIQSVVEKHAAVVRTAPVPLATPTGANAKARELARAKAEQARKEQRVRRVATLAAELDRLFSDLGYPYVDDRDIDRILEKITGFTDGNFTGGFSNDWPYNEATSTWQKLVYNGNPIGARQPYEARVGDFVRDLHGALHDRRFFEQVIADACEHREYLFKNSSMRAPSLSKATTVLTGWATKRLDSGQRQALADGRVSLWTAFLDGERASGQAQTLTVPDEQQLAFQKELRDKLLAKAGDKDKLDAALRELLVHDERLRQWVRTSEAGPDALRKLTDAAGRDAATQLAWLELDRKVKANKEHVDRRTEAQSRLPAPAGTSNEARHEADLLTEAKDAIQLFRAAHPLVKTDAWASELASGPLSRLVTGRGVTPAEAEPLRAALEGERVALAAFVGSPEWQLLAAAVEDSDDGRLLFAIATAKDALDRARQPLSDLVSRVTETDGNADAAVAKLQPGDALAVEAATAKQNRASWLAAIATMQRMAVGPLAAPATAIRELRTWTSIKERADAAIAAGKAAILDAGKDWLAKTLAAMKQTNDAQPTGDRQDLKAIAKDAEANLARVLEPIAEAGTWQPILGSDPADQTVQKLQQALLRDPRATIQPTVDRLVLHFTRVFENNRKLVASDLPILAAIVTDADLGTAVDALRKQTIARIPSVFAKLVAETPYDGGDDDHGTVLAGLFRRTLASPEIHYLFAQPGSRSRIAAFRSEFYQAFRHRLDEAVRAERDVDYDYWWLTFYPKAIPLDNATFDSQSLLEIEFPERVIPQERYARWLQDARAVLPEDGEPDGDRGSPRSELRKSTARLEAVTSVLVSLRAALDAEGLEGHHPGIRKVALAALGKLRGAPLPNGDSHVERLRQQVERTYRQVMRELARPLCKAGLYDEVPLEQQGHEELRSNRSLWEWLKNDEQPDADIGKALRDLKVETTQFGWWYQQLVDPTTAKQPDREDARDLARFLLAAFELGLTDCPDERRRTRSSSRAGAARALAKAPFGYEHLVFAAANAHDGAAPLPETVDLISNAFFNGVARFEPKLSKDCVPLAGSREQAEAKAITDFLFEECTSGPPDAPNTPGTSATKPCKEQLDRAIRKVLELPAANADSPPKETKAQQKLREIEDQAAWGLDQIQHANETMQHVVGHPTGVGSIETLVPDPSGAGAATELVFDVVQRMATSLAGVRQSASEMHALVTAGTTTVSPSAYDGQQQAMTPADLILHRLAVAGADHGHVFHSNNPYLDHPELWRWELRRGSAEAHLRRTIVHMFRSAYPATPHASTIQAEVSRHHRRLEALTYSLLRGVWVRHRQRARVLGRTKPNDDGTARLRADLFDQLRHVLPVGLARDVIGRIEAETDKDLANAVRRHAPQHVGDYQSMYTWIDTIFSSPTAVDHLQRKLVAQLYPGLWSALGDLSESRLQDVPHKDIAPDHYQRFVRAVKPELQPGVQILELLPASRDDLVGMAVNEGGAIFQAAAQADAAAAYDVNQYTMAARLVRETLSDLGDSAGTTSGEPSADATGIETDEEPAPGAGEQAMLDELTREGSRSKHYGYNAGGSGEASFYGRARAAMAYAKRREYLDAAITAAGRGDRLARWVIRPSDLRSELAKGEGKTIVAASHSGYPNGDQPFHMLVKIPHDAKHQDWVGRNFIYFNSSYVATEHLPLSSWMGQFGWLSKGVLALLYFPLVTSAEEYPFGAKFPFQWDVDNAREQTALFRTPNLLGGRIELDDTDKIKYSEIRKLLAAEEGFIRATRSAQSARLGEVMEELEGEGKQIDERVQKHLRAQREAARSSGSEVPAPAGDGAGSDG